MTKDKTKSSVPTADDPLALDGLFAGGGEPWMPLLKPTIEAQPEADDFIGPHRDQSIVPVRELTFQALKPNPPEKWKVVVFGQNPYPRVESATGIAMFDNTFNEWVDSRFGRVTSIRCIIKAGCIWKYGIEFKTPVAKIRGLLAKNQIVQPPEWFQAMLTQGVLLLNAALTASSDGSLSTDRHTKFWRPVVERVVEAILEAKQNTEEEKNEGVVFAWWGAHAKTLRKIVEKLLLKYPDVPVRHVDHYNPAAQGDAFCKGNHFADINGALADLGMEGIDWLPEVGWDAALTKDHETADRMGAFISETMELHKLYLERLQGAKDEGLKELASIDGVMSLPLMSFSDAIAPVTKVLKNLDHFVKHAVVFAKKKVGKKGTASLNEHEIAALHLYTMGSHFYSSLNAALRNPNRGKIKPYLAYLRLFFSALSKLAGVTESLWRGVKLDLRKQYPEGATITWWGVSSCTPKLSVAQGFLGARGHRTLFEVKSLTAVSIRSQSAFTGEDEFILAPGTQLKVSKVQSKPGGLSVVKLEELPDQRMVS